MPCGGKAGTPPRTRPRAEGPNLHRSSAVHLTPKQRGVRYEAGTSAPTFDVLRNIAIALHVSTDSLVFAEHERGPGDDLRLASEATADLHPAEQAMVKQLIEAVLLKHQAKRWAS
jgi:transcriptional regulator with XRE-family HTH domain